MENQADILDDNISENNALQLNSTMMGFLSETAKWAKFLSILGFIGIGLMVLGAFSMSVFLSSTDSQMPFAGNSMIIVAIYLGLSILYFFPVLYLYKFSNHTKTAINQKNNYALQDSLMNLKSHYKFMGISAIVIIVMYVGIFAFAATGSLF